MLSKRPERVCKLFRVSVKPPFFISSLKLQHASRAISDWILLLTAAVRSSCKAYKSVQTYAVFK